MLMAEDMDRAVRFWCDAFGCRKALGGDAYTELSLSGASVALHAGHDGTLRETGLNIEVDDVDAAMLAVTSAGGTIATPPEARPGEPIMLGKCADTEGNVFGVVQHVAGRQPVPAHERTYWPR
jgi:predicted enzyme related to lactoylglutathione lyase